MLKMMSDTLNSLIDTRVLSLYISCHACIYAIILFLIFMYLVILWCHLQLIHITILSLESVITDLVIGGAIFNEVTCNRLLVK